jgi:transcriptional regulator GlxA family with amidase domain
MQIAFALYPSFTALDLMGAYQVFAGWPDGEVLLCASGRAPVLDDRGAVALVPGAAFADVPSPDVVVVPGSGRPFESLHDDALLGWLAHTAPTATWVTSVCTGSGLLAAAGLLDARRAATHWAYRDALAAMGVEVRTERCVFDGKFVTGGGVTAGIDMALALTARQYDEQTAKVLQLALEYDPSPPFPGGTEETSEPAVVEIARRWLAAATGVDIPS